MEAASGLAPCLLLAVTDSPGRGLVNPSTSDSVDKRRRIGKKEEAIVDAQKGEVVQTLDLDIWDQLPDSAKEDILVKLPAMDLLRFRSVQKNWKGLIDCPLFRKIYDHESPYVTAFLTFCNRKTSSGSTYIEYPAYFPETDTWCKLPSFLIQPQMIRKFRCNTKGSRRSTTGQGLWCIQPLKLLDSVTYVLSNKETVEITFKNPITGWRFTVPACRSSHRNFQLCRVSMLVVDRKSKSFQVICAGTHKKACSKWASGFSLEGCTCQLMGTHVFRSSSEQWTEVGDLPLANLFFTVNKSRFITYAECKGKIYFVVKKSTESHIMIMSYNTLLEEWKIIPGSLRPLELEISEGANQRLRLYWEDICLFTRGESLMLAVRCTYGFVHGQHFDSEHLWDANGQLFWPWHPMILSWDTALHPHAVTWTKVKVGCLSLPISTLEPDPSLIRLARFPPMIREIQKHDIVCSTGISVLRRVAYPELGRWNTAASSKGEFLFYTYGNKGALLYNISSETWRHVSSLDSLAAGGDKGLITFSTPTLTKGPVAIECTLSAITEFP